MYTDIFLHIYIHNKTSGHNTPQTPTLALNAAHLATRHRFSLCAKMIFVYFTVDECSARNLLNDGIRVLSWAFRHSFSRFYLMVSFCSLSRLSFTWLNRQVFETIRRCSDLCLYLRSSQLLLELRILKYA